MSSTENLEHWRIAQDEETFSKELEGLLQAVSELEGRVEEVRNGVIVKKDKIMLNEVSAIYKSEYFGLVIHWVGVFLVDTWLTPELLRSLTM